MRVAQKDPVFLGPKNIELKGYTGRMGSLGMTLDDLAELMANLGCRDAMNFDGGSSTIMATNEKPLNQPVTGKEKPVSNAILVIRR